jgi:hypothetical protein
VCFFSERSMVKAADGAAAPAKGSGAARQPDPKSNDRKPGAGKKLPQPKRAAPPAATDGAALTAPSPAARPATPAFDSKNRKGSTSRPTVVDPYVVIVRNAEVDLSAIYAEAIARFVMPKPDRADNVPADSKVPAITVRQETLTALIRYDPGSFSASPDSIRETVATRVLLGKPVSVIATTSDRKRDLQSDLVRATLTTSKNVQADELAGHLKDVPGFVNCRRVRTQVFHAVFANKDALLSTKMLLDEFESEGLRITVQLNAPMEEAYDSYVRERAEGEGMMMNAISE